MQTSRDPIQALTLDEIPDFQDFLNSDISEMMAEDDDFMSPFNLDLLKERQVAASQVLELRDLVVETGIPDFPVILCNLPHSMGQVFLEDEIPFPLMFLDSKNAKTRERLCKIYLHEAAHLITQDQDHNFQFVAIHGLFRCYAGYAQSSDDYDYSGTDRDGLTMAGAKELATAVAEYAVGQTLPVAKSIDVILTLLNTGVGYEREADADSIVKRFKEVMIAIG